MSEIQGESPYDKLPDVTSYNFEMLYSDSAVVRAKMNAPQRDVYKGENPYVEMPKGIKVVFYDKSKKPETTLTANYGIRREKDEKMEVRSNVIVVNSQGQQLNTEKLIWDEKTEKLTTDVLVKITTQDEIIWGQGLESNQTFTDYTIKKITGKIKLKNSPVE